MELKRRHCMRCGALGRQIHSATEEIWDCPNRHGVIYRTLRAVAPKLDPVAPPETGNESKKNLSAGQ
jgi:hypothetical protein